MSGIGVGIGWQSGPEWLQQSLDLLKPQVYFNWLADPELMADERYMPMCFSLHDATPYLEVGKAFPHKLFLCGNEPELSITLTTPEQAKEFAITWLKSLGPDSG